MLQYSSKQKFVSTGSRPPVHCRRAKLDSCGRASEKKSDDKKRYALSCAEMITKYTQGRLPGSRRSTSWLRVILSTRRLWNRGFASCPFDQTTLRNYRRNQQKALVPCHCRQYYNGLPKRTRRPDDRSLFADGRCVQPIRACDDTRKGALRNSKCQSQGQANRQTAPDNRPNPHHLPAPLSGV